MGTLWKKSSKQQNRRYPLSAVRSVEQLAERTLDNFVSFQDPANPTSSAKRMDKSSEIPSIQGSMSEDATTCKKTLSSERLTFPQYNNLFSCYLSFQSWESAALVPKLDARECGDIAVKTDQPETDTLDG